MIPIIGGRSYGFQFLTDHSNEYNPDAINTLLQTIPNSRVSYQVYSYKANGWQDVDLSQQNNKYKELRSHGYMITTSIYKNDLDIGSQHEAFLLANKGIRLFKKTKDTNCTASIGFSPGTNEWFGWSHRAIYSFTIGSKVKKGDTSYIASNIEEALEDATRFWSDGNRINISSKSLYNDKTKELLKNYLNSSLDFNLTKMTH